MDFICLIAAPKAGVERLGEVLDHCEDLAHFPESQRALAPDADHGRRVVSFPLFDGDPGADDLAARADVRFILVVRRQIDNYIDLCAVNRSGRLDADAFSDWLDGQERWYGRWRHHLGRRGLPCPILRYESDIDQPAERVVRRFSAAAGQVGVLLGLPGSLPEVAPLPRPVPLAERQDNWTDFSRAVFARGLERRAFGYPL